MAIGYTVVHGTGTVEGSEAWVTVNGDMLWGFLSVLGDAVGPAWPDA